MVKKIAKKDRKMQMMSWISRQNVPEETPVHTPQLDKEEQVLVVSYSTDMS